MTPGDRVVCPAERGQPSFQAIVTHVSPVVHTNIYGRKYVWVTVKGYGVPNHGHSSVWPDFRLRFV